MKHLLKIAPHKQPLWLASTALLLGLTGVAHSQPGVNGAQGGNQQGGWGQGQQGGWGQRGGNQQGGNQQGGNQQNRAQMREQQLRQMLTAAGYSDKTLQDAVIAFSNAQDKAKQPLRQSLQELTQAAGSATATDEEVATILNEFRTSVEAAQVQWNKDVKTLDAAVGFSKKPRLEALLTSLGLIGDEAAFVGGGGAGGRGGMGMGGRGGMGGGGMGGGMGGMGGGFGGGGMDGMGGPPGPPPDQN